MARPNHQGSSKRRKAAFRLGLRAETIAVWYLRFKGYRILDRRYRSAAGEIDIIARHGDALCFVEVKARRTFQAAIDAVTVRNKARIIKTAKIWLASHRGYETVTWRFDIIAILPRALPRHFISAFQAGS